MTNTNEIIAACDPACKSAKYRYMGCDMTTNKKMEICTDNPRGTLNFKPWKKCFPMSIEVGSFPFTKWNSLYFDLNSDNIRQSNETLFNIIEAEDVIKNGLNSWSSICTYDNQNCSTCSPIKVIWATRTEDMKGYPNVLAVTYQKLEADAGEPTCTFDCESSYIALNATDGFIDVPLDSKTPPDPWFYTNRTGPHSRFDWYDLQSVIEHEMGHWLGFEDNQEECNSSYTGLMQTPLPPNTERSISNSDRCMFEKLYCCPANSTSVGEEPATISSTFTIFPNPTSTSVTIALSPSSAQYAKRLRVVDIAGKIVFEQVFPAGNSDCTVQTNGLSKGSYLFIMTFDGINGSYAEKVVIQ
jgi:hypothetical protein